MSSAPLICLHGLGSDSSCFASSSAQDFLRAQTVLCPDLPAHGGNGNTASLPRLHSLSHVAKLKVRDLRESHRACHIIAHSMGAAIALLMTARITPLSFISVEGNLLAQDGLRLSQRTAATDKAKFVRHNIHRMIERAEQAPDSTTRDWARTLRLVDPAAFHEYAVSTTRWSNSGRLFEIYRALPCPKTYIYGEHSRVPEVIDMLTHHHLEQHCIEGSGHFPMLEKPHPFWQCVAAFYRHHEIFDKSS